MQIRSCDCCGRMIQPHESLTLINLNHFVPRDIGEEALEGYDEITVPLDLCRQCYYSYIDDANALFNKYSQMLRHNQRLEKEIRGE